MVEAVQLPRGARAPSDRAGHRASPSSCTRGSGRRRSSVPRASLGLAGRGRRDRLQRREGARATRRLLSSPEPPTAIVFDSDLLAVTGLGVAQQMGFTRPGRPLDRRLGRLADQPGRASAADGAHARHRAYGSDGHEPPARRDRRPGTRRRRDRHGASSRRAAAPARLRGSSR